MACPSMEKFLANIVEELVFSDTKWLKSQDLSEYIEIAVMFSKKTEKYMMKSCLITLENLLEASSFFKNQGLCDYLIITYVLSSINRDNCVYFLDNSYMKLNINPEFKQTPGSTWMRLYNLALDNVVKHFNYIIDNFFNRMKLLNEIVLEELLDKLENT
jgi:hypothetical protein